MNPCLLDRGTLLVAPADSPRIFAFDAATGQTLWQTGTRSGRRRPVAGRGRRLADRRRPRALLDQPEGRRPRPGEARLARRAPTDRATAAACWPASCVLWPTRDKLYLFDQQTAELRKAVDLGARGASGGNLLVADGQLLIATENELMAPSSPRGCETSIDTRQTAGLRSRLHDYQHEPTGDPCLNTTTFKPYKN